MFFSVEPPLFLSESSRERPFPGELPLVLSPLKKKMAETETQKRERTLEKIGRCVAESSGSSS